MSDAITAVFVYGTLKQGEERSRLWPHAPVRIEQATVRGRLFDLGPYPALAAGDDIISGEVWHFPPEQMAETLRVLDAIEGYDPASNSTGPVPNGETDGYVRRPIVCTLLDGRTVAAHTYYFGSESELAKLRPMPPDMDGLCRWKKRTR